MVEYAYRTHGTAVDLAAGIMLVTLRDGLVQRLAITCAGNWSAETEARVVEETGALGPRAAERRRSCHPMTADTIEVTGAVTERLFGSLLGALELATVHLGVRLGLYDALATPRTAAGLAEAAGIDERYAREWLEQQAISGLVTVTRARRRRPPRLRSGPRASALVRRPGVAGVRRLDGSPDGRRRARAATQLPEVYRTGGRHPVRRATATTCGSARACSTVPASSAS